MDKVWTDTTVESSRDASLRGISTGIIKPNSTRGARVIVLQIGGVNGFVPETGRVYVKGQKNLEYTDFDYHQDVDSDLYEHWFKMVLSKLPENSTVIMDNASYHKRLGCEVPNSKSTKPELVKFLSKHEVPFPKRALKNQLWQITKEKLKDDLPCQIDSLAAEKSIRILRTPPYHPKLNPIEEIWALIKGRVSRRNICYKTAEVKRMTKEEINRVTAEDWQHRVNHSIKEYYRLLEIQNSPDGRIDDFFLVPEAESESDTESEAEHEQPSNKVPKKPKPQLKELICDKCGYLATSLYILRKHAKRHEDKTCQKCGKFFKSNNLSPGFQQLTNHLRYCRGNDSEDAFKCPICSKIFTNRKTLWSHKKICTAEDPKCDKCNQCFRSRHLLGRHKCPNFQL